MTNGYKILWTDFALSELESTIEYLEENWTQKELRNLAVEIEETLNLLSHNPNLFQASDIKKEIRRVVVAKHNTLYYRLKNNTIEIISFFSNRQSPKKRKLKYISNHYITAHGTSLLDFVSFLFVFHVKNLS